MKIINLTILFTLGIWLINYSTAIADSTWLYKMIGETEILTKNRFYLNTSADLNQNGKYEIIVADFGRNGEIQPGWRTKPDLYNLFLLEWSDNKLNVLWSKKWNSKDATNSVEESRKYSFWKAIVIHALKKGNQTIVETAAPFLMLAWENGKYVLHEQYKATVKPANKIGSHAFPWFTGQCHPVFNWRRQYPRECLVAIRDFKRDGRPRILTLVIEYSDGSIIKPTDKYRILSPNKFTLRVRTWVPGFPIEWQQRWPRQIKATRHDIYNSKLPGPMVVYETGSIAEIKRLGGFPYFVFDWNKKRGYHLRKLNWKKGPKEGLDPYWLEKYRAGFTRSKKILETWGYHRVKAYDGYYSPELRSMSIRPDLQGHTWHDLKFKTHGNYNGIGYYDLVDLDDDGLQEIIIVEETGKRKANQDEHGIDWEYSDVKDYIRILKWNGSKYVTKWISPAYKLRGTKFLFADIKGNKRKSLVVFSPSGRIQVLERI